MDIKYLTQGEKWLEYAVRMQLLGEDPEGLEGLRAEALQDKKIKKILREVQDFHSTVITYHGNISLPLYKLNFLLDLGFDQQVPQIRRAVKEIMSHKDEHGVYQSHIYLHKKYGGNKTDVYGWCICDAALQMLALLKAGVDYDKHLRQGVEYLASLIGMEGYPCVSSPELRGYRGPGQEGEGCPFATLQMLRLFSHLPQYLDSGYANNCIHFLLDLWENSAQKHPYHFSMGEDFLKLRAPLMWFDLISVVDSLSRFACAKQDPRFQDMMSQLFAKADELGHFRAEAVYLKGRGWDFGQKKYPSAYMTFLCMRIRIRMYGQLGRAV